VAQPPRTCRFTARLREVTPRQGKGTLGQAGRHGGGTSSLPMPKLPSTGFNPVGRGVGVLARAFRPSGEGASGTVLVANRTREIRPSGMTRGACGNVARGAGLRPTAKAVERPPDPKVHDAPQIYPGRRCKGRITGIIDVPGGRKAASLPWRVDALVELPEDVRDE